MGYLFILLALLFGVTKGYCGKKTSGMITDLSSAVGFNAVRMLLCIPIGVLFVFIRTRTLSVLAADGTTLLISASAGFATSVFVVTWLIAVRTGAYMMVDVFPTLGVIVPVIASRIFFGEEIRWNHIVGILLLTAAAYVLCTYNRDIGKARLTPGAFLVLALSGFSYGMTSFSQKWFRYGSGADVSVYNFYTYLTSAAVLTLVFCCVSFRKRKGRDREGAEGTERKDQNTRSLAFYVVVMSLCIFLHSLFSTEAAGLLPSSQLYPLMQGGALILSMIMSAVCFGEKITGRCVLGIAMAFAALFCTNCL